MDVREKLVELLTEFYGCDPMYYDVDALAIAQHLITHGVTVQEWISVDDRLPDNGQEVFIAYVFPSQRSFGVRHFYSASVYHIDDGNGIVNGPHFENEGFRGMRVTHWMPIPQPPKGE